MQVFIVFLVHGIDFKTDNAEVAACHLARFSNIGNGGHVAAFACEHEDFLKTCGGNGLHFFFHLGKVKTGPVNLVVAVEAAVDAVIFAVVC